MRRATERRRGPIRAAALLSMILSAAAPALGEDAVAPPAAGTGRARSSSSGWPPGGKGSGAAPVGWSATALVATVLAACGGLAVAARRMGPRDPAGAVRVVGRVGLSPRHSVHVLRVGGRTLLVGTGPQGPPALIAELDQVADGSGSTAPREEAGS
jgi:flagellar protein FliO/FliZ